SSPLFGTSNSARACGQSATSPCTVFHPISKNNSLLLLSLRLWASRLPHHRLPGTVRSDTRATNDSIPVLVSSGSNRCFLRIINDVPSNPRLFCRTAGGSAALLNILEQGASHEKTSCRVHRGGGPRRGRPAVDAGAGNGPERGRGERRGRPRRRFARWRSPRRRGPRVLLSRELLPRELLPRELPSSRLQ